MTDETTTATHSDTAVAEATEAATLTSSASDSALALQKALAIVRGEPITEFPQDLYIPPEALEVILDLFEGPLDLLLYLIRKHNLDILDIPIAKITEQYMQYVDLMHGLHMELAAEYLVMAAILAEIKSRMLLPRSTDATEEDEEDPRAKLIQQLQAYERLKIAAEALDQQPRLERDLFLTQTAPPDFSLATPLPTVLMQELVAAVQAVIQRASLVAHHHIMQEPLSVRERMTIVLTKLNENNYLEFTQLFTTEENRMGVVVSFIAILELMKQSVIEIVQSEPFSPIYVRKR